MMTLIPAVNAEDARDGRIESSDGTVIAGKLSLTPGSGLKLQSADGIHTLALDRVREIRLTPEKEDLERNWRFKEAGQTAKEFFGEPYPVRSLRATIELAGGETLTGHLYTTVLYVESGESARKVVLPSKQRGQEGQTLAALTYVSRVSFVGAAVADEVTSTLRIKWPLPQARDQVAILTRGSLARFEGSTSGVAGEFKVSSPLGEEFFVAINTGGKIVIGWPAARDDQALARARSALPQSEDFFDQRRVLGVLRDAEGENLYALVMALRKGGTTLNETRSQPWRVEIYRWKTEPDTGLLMLAGQGYLFRGAVAKGEAPPTVELSAKLWQVHKEGGVWIVGE
jgi:hypothetical protein